MNKNELAAAAKILGCHPQKILAHRLLDDGGIVVIAPTGQKFRYSAEELAAVVPSPGKAKPPAPKKKASK